MWFSQFLIAFPLSFHFPKTIISNNWSNKGFILMYWFHIRCQSYISNWLLKNMNVILCTKVNVNSNDLWEWREDEAAGSSVKTRRWPDPLWTSWCSLQEGGGVELESKQEARTIYKDVHILTFVNQNHSVYQLLFVFQGLAVEHTQASWGTQSPILTTFWGKALLFKALQWAEKWLK